MQKNYFFKMLLFTHFVFLVSSRILGNEKEDLEELKPLPMDIQLQNQEIIESIRESRAISQRAPSRLKDTPDLNNAENKSNTDEENKEEKETESGINKNKLYFFLLGSGILIIIGIGGIYLWKSG